MTSVLVLGGGVAGMSAAHHLKAQGMDVTVIEANSIPGGKARSFPAGGTKDLPAEHGFRFFAGFYHHIIETLQQIQSYDGKPVSDHLVAVKEIGFARYDEPVARVDPCGSGAAPITDLADLVERLTDRLVGFGLSAAEIKAFAGHMWRVLTSCKERRIKEFNKQTWWDFIEADKYSPAYGIVFGRCIRTLVAADPKKASAKVMGDCAASLLLSLTVGSDCFDRILDGPTSDVWINPWYAQLDAAGVDFEFDSWVDEILCDGTVVTGVNVAHGGNTTTRTADLYLSTLPVEKMAHLVNDDLLTADADLAKLIPLSDKVAWMNGVQFYLKTADAIFNGHLLVADSDWSVTAIQQAAYWPDVDFSTLHDGSIKDCLSAIISDFDTKGLSGKDAMHCTPEEIRSEVWNQLKKGLIASGINLDASNVGLYQQDPAIILNHLRHPHYNREPLFVNEIGTWDLRPKPKTKIANFFLAGDYTQTNADLATMESADESARRAVNEMMGATTLNIVEVHEHPICMPARAFDRICYTLGLPYCISDLSPLGSPTLI